MRPLSLGREVLDGSSELSFEPFVCSDRRAVHVFWGAGVRGDFSSVLGLVVVGHAVLMGIDR